MTPSADTPRAGEGAGSATADAYVPLFFVPGEAYQLDLRHEIVLINGVRLTPTFSSSPATDTHRGRDQATGLSPPRPRDARNQTDHAVSRQTQSRPKRPKWSALL